MIIKYEGDTVCSQGWERCESETGGYRLTEDNALELKDSSYGEFQSRLTCKWNCDFEHPVVIETRVKIGSCEDIGGCGIFFGDGTVCELVTLFSDRVEFANSMQSYCMDTTDDYHQYSIAVNGGKVSLAVDGNNVLSSVLKKAPCRDHVGFGGFGSPGSARWDFFRCEYRQRSPLVGGTVSFDDLRTVRKDELPLNFSFAEGFSDGTIWLYHSIGQHVQDERKSSLWSLDNGETWSPPDVEIKTLDTCQLSDGSVISLDVWDAEIKTTHTGEISRWATPRTPAQSEAVEIELPFPAAMLLHRSMVALRGGRLLAIAYGRIDEDDPKSITYLLCSEDNGRTWEYLSRVPKESPGTEGFCEPCLLELANGDLICLMRTGGSLGEWDRRENCGPLMQSKSTDGGRTWSEPVAIASYGVDPHAVKLSDGTIVAAAGRPGVYVLVDFTGTGENWQRIDIYSGPGSSYTSLVETGPGKVLLFYDESAFCLEKGSGVFNRIVCVEMVICKAE